MIRYSANHCFVSSHLLPLWTFASQIDETPQKSRSFDRWVRFLEPTIDSSAPQLSRGMSSVRYDKAFASFSGYVSSVRIERGSNSSSGHQSYSSFRSRQSCGNSHFVDAPSGLESVDSALQVALNRNVGDKDSSLKAPVPLKINHLRLSSVDGSDTSSMLSLDSTQGEPVDFDSPQSAATLSDMKRTPTLSPTKGTFVNHRRPESSLERIQRRGRFRSFSVLASHGLVKSPPETPPNPLSHVSGTVKEIVNGNHASTFSSPGELPHHTRPSLLSSPCVLSVPSAALSDTVVDPWEMMESISSSTAPLTHGSRAVPPRPPRSRKLAARLEKSMDIRLQVMKSTLLQNSLREFLPDGSRESMLVSTNFCGSDHSI